MEYFLFLDDIRAIDMIYKGQDTSFLLVRSYDAFVHCIKENGIPLFISFDNDLGEDENGVLLPDGYACAKWLVFESGLDLRKLRFYVHSSNPVAKVQIESLLRNYLKFLNE